MSHIAVLLATYNGAKYLPEMLASLENQTEQQFLCYIHDDGSEDDTCQIIEKRIQKHPEKYRVLQGEPQGSAKSNFLWMLKEVEADYYMFADQDDVWLPEKIEKSICRLKAIEKEAGKPACVFTDMYVVDEKLQVLDASFLHYIGRSPQRIRLSQVLTDNPAAGCTMIFNRALRQKAIQLQDVSKIEMHDAWVFALAACFGEESVDAIEQPMVYYRQHGNNEMGAVQEGAYQKIVRNGRQLLSGEFFQSKKAFIRNARMLAEQLTRVDGLPQESLEFLTELSQIDKKNKIERIRFYKKNDITRLHGTKWMYLWV